MPFDVFNVVSALEKTSPYLFKKMGSKLLSWISPFNSHLKAQLLEWTPLKASFKIKCHRKVKNHIGGIHAGAIFTLGETCAGFILVRNFSLKKYRPIMSDVSVRYEKQARGATTGTAEVSKADILKIKKGLKDKKPQFIWIETEIKNEKKELIALVKTKWQVKPWDQVRIKK